MLVSHWGPQTINLNAPLDILNSSKLRTLLIQNFFPVIEAMSVHAVYNAALGAPLFGGMIANAMYGVLICQTAWYFRAFPQDPTYLKLFIAMLCVSETVGLVIDTKSRWYYFIQRGIGVDPINLITCSYWSVAAYFVPTEFTCFLAEIFFIKRMWSLANQKNFILAIVVLVPFLVGWGFTIDFLRAMQGHLCYPQREVTNFSLLMSFGLRVLSSGVVTASMCFLLYRQASPLFSTGMVQTQKMLRIVKSLAIGSLSTGLVMWLTSISFTITYILLPNSPIAYGIYGVRGSFFANAILVSLNGRVRYRRILRESIALRTFPSALAFTRTNPATASTRNANHT